VAMTLAWHRRRGVGGDPHRVAWRWVWQRLEDRCSEVRVPRPRTRCLPRGWR
jgi:hypothetical protein